MKKYTLLVLFTLLLQFAHAQSAFMKRGMDDNFLIDRIDILSGRVSDTLHTALQQLSREDVIRYVEDYLTDNDAKLTKRQKEDLRTIISKSGEYAANSDGAEKSKYPLFRRFYQRKPDFFQYKTKDATIILNPIIYYQQSVDNASSGQNIFFNSRGLEVRGQIAKRIGFYSTFTDNQERGPLHHQQYVSNYSAVPGAAFYKDFKKEKPGKAQDYLYAAGYLDADVVKDIVNVSFGHDRFQLGDGYRSLFLGDMGTNYLFLKLNTRIGKINYQNLYMELTPQYFRKSDRLLPKKYATMHHLSINATRWLNLGVFESVVFGRKEGFDFQYMNPIILYRSVEQGLGSPDNAMLGMNFKINPGIGAIVYGQLLLDEFKFSEFTARKGWWGNKYGLQLGTKIADLFGVKNLLIQLEANAVRPFTYTFRDSVANYTHYNQALAHPYGANFLEGNFIVQYKPIRNLYVTLKAFYNKQGRDTSVNGKTYGGDIRKDYDRRNSEYGISLFNGFPSETLFGNLNLSYELRNNLFLDLGGTLRTQNFTGKKASSQQSIQIYSGLRLNAARRQYDY